MLNADYVHTESPQPLREQELWFHSSAGAQREEHHALASR